MADKPREGSSDSSDGEQVAVQRRPTTAVSSTAVKKSAVKKVEESETPLHDP